MIDFQNIKLATWIILVSLSFLIGGILYLGHSSKDGIKYIHWIAIAVITGGVATLYKEAKSSETNQKILSEAIEAKVELKALREKNDSLLKQSGTQSDQLTIQSKQLTVQGEQLTSQGERLINQEKLIGELSQLAQEAKAKVEAEREERMSIDKKHLSGTLARMQNLENKSRDMPFQFRNIEQNRGWINEALSLVQSESDNTFLRQSKPLFDKWTDLTAILKTHSQFLSEPNPRYKRTRDFFYDEETSKKMVNDEVYKTSRTIVEVTRNAYDLLRSNP